MQYKKRLGIQKDTAPIVIIGRQLSESRLKGLYTLGNAFVSPLAARAQGRRDMLQISWDRAGKLMKNAIEGPFDPSHKDEGDIPQGRRNQLAYCAIVRGIGKKAVAFIQRDSLQGIS
ncbi:hypothetical protein P4H66_13200 [Paenibacillus dokdonensis]|uniref:Uncharacterized protein n=1 Tax=Paenibacillus dokdonensis TaxID=2567944 RepID=A0ABU6GNX9_9BACL|nr:hypothetical protein [Paenibacillus dokdonensis]MEC0240807.1 hypothetical protein [Paenibacillus dokdonensis]